MNVKFPESFPFIELAKFAAEHEMNVVFNRDGGLALKPWAEGQEQEHQELADNVIQFRGKGA